MCLKRFLFDLITRIELLEFDWDKVLLNIYVTILITDVISEKVEFLVLVVDKFEDELLNVFLVLRQFFVGVKTRGEFEEFFRELLGDVLGHELEIEIVEFLQVEGQE